MKALTPEQFAAAWSELRPTLTLHAARLVGPNDAEDFVQEAALIALSILDRYNAEKGRTGFRNWMLSILTNLGRNARRAPERELPLPDAALTRIIENRASDPAMADAQLDEPDLLTLVAAAPLRCLRHRRREVWELHCAGRTQTEIAVALGLTQQAISYQIGQIIAELCVSAGDLINQRTDGYPSAEAMFRDVSRVTIYRRPKRRGDAPKFRRSK